jgi:hypothetical protein
VRDRQVERNYPRPKASSTSSELQKEEKKETPHEAANDQDNLAMANNKHASATKDSNAKITELTDVHVIPLKQSTNEIAQERGALSWREC